jgi:hypothetical protein
MPRQSLHRTIKRWRRYQPRADWKLVPKDTRGLYVLYSHRKPAQYQVVYIGIAGLGQTGGGGIRGRLASHDRSKPGWTHYSLFEVHDNVTRDEIREIESLLLGIFRHDERIQLSNKQKGSGALYKLRNPLQWKGSWGLASLRPHKQHRQRR